MKKTVKKSKPRLQGSPIRLGNKVYIRTVTHHYTGKIVLVTKDEILLRDAAWIADSARWATAMATGVLSEVEPYPDDVLVSVCRGAICDVSTWKHELPRIQK